MSNHRIGFVSAGFLLLVLLAGFSSSALATNMYETHGYDYEFDGDVLFPVVWDLRGAWFEYRDYALAYLERDAADWADLKITEILEDALDAGMNTVLIRNEGWMDADHYEPSTDAPTQYLEERADLVRALGLHVMLGGFRDILTQESHNLIVQTLIEEYIDGMSTPPPTGWGSVIGIHGFDEVDGRYDNETAQDSLLMIKARLEDLHDWSNDEIDPYGISYPLGCFMAKPALHVPSLYYPHDDTTGTVYQLCGRQDFPMLDWYPCRTFQSTHAGVFLPSAQVWGATDLRPSGEYNYYHAYCTRDELWSVEYDARRDKTIFHVYKVGGEGQVGPVSFQGSWDHEVEDMDWPFETASSDYRASDIGDRSGGYHDLNGAVVMYHPGADVDEAQIVFHDGGDLTLTDMPDSQVSEETLFFCVGEEDYVQSPQFADKEGIIGTAGLRVLWCGEGLDAYSEPVIRIRMFAKDHDEIVPEASMDLCDPEDFTPVGAVWGYFWDNDEVPFRRSGFVLYDEEGQYVVVHQDETTGDWETDGLPHTGLFDGMIDPTVLFAYRQTTWPAEHFSPARDLLLSVVTEPQEDGFHLQWRAGTGSGWDLDSPSEMYFDAGIESDDIDCASFRRVWDGNGTRFWFGGDGIVLRYNVHPFSPGWEDERDATEVPPESIGTSGADWTLMPLPMRVRHTRNPWVNALLYDIGSPDTEFSVRSGEITDETEGSGAEYASTYLLFNNLCSPGTSWASGHDLGAYDIEFEYGIMETEGGGDCLFANIQAFGRYQQENATFLPSHETGTLESDTLLYMTVAPIVHGCRGISFYALDMALMCGSPGDATMPDRLLNWGPSRDAEENGDRDMVRAVHDVVGMLTGEYGGPDFLDALVDHDEWEVMDSGEAANANWNGDEYTALNGVPELNFIALKSYSTDNILLIVSNDYSEDPSEYDGSIIWFPELDLDGYLDPVSWGGFSNPYWTDAPEHGRSEGGGHSVGLEREERRTRVAGRPMVVDIAHRGDIDDLALDFAGMPPFTVSLISIERGPRDGRSACSVVEEQLTASRSAGGTIELRISGYHGPCELVVYDLAGRIVSELFDGVLSGGEMDFTIGAGDLSRGMYFVTMLQDGEMAGVQRILVY